jgi:primosomal protein N' (replication factor Y)
MFAEVAVNLPIEGTFHYRVPASLVGFLVPGHLVEVQFGSQKSYGIILGFSLSSPVQDVKPILGLIDRSPVLNEAQLQLAHWMSKYYLSPLSECIRLFVPPGMARRGDNLYTPLVDPALIEIQGDVQHRLVSLLAQRGALRGRQMARSLPRMNWEKAAAQLIERGLLLKEPVLDPPAVHPRQVRRAESVFAPEKLDMILQDMSETHSRSKRVNDRCAAIVRLVASAPTGVDVRQIYDEVAGAKFSDLYYLADRNLIRLFETERIRDPLSSIAFIPDKAPVLTRDQQQAVDLIREMMDNPQSEHVCLIHGVTGSGKTEIYMASVDHVLQKGQTAIVLVPEIALTAQTIRRYGARFFGRVGLIHSQLSAGERFDTWRRIREGQIDVVVGPRSALFSPLGNIGLIVIDECHDDSYKQSPSMVQPYYHTLPASIELARLCHATVVLGSATPDVVTYRMSTSHSPESKYVSLPSRIMGHRQAIANQAVHFHHEEETRYKHASDDPSEAVMIELPPVQVVDMRQELRANNRSMFSRELRAAIEHTLDKNQQVILFLNRRGMATHVFCRDCGFVLRCPHCQIPMAWHGSEGKGILVCHQCDHRRTHPTRCPECDSTHIRYFGGGTERIEREVRDNFPAARPLRWDRDTTRGKGAHDELLAEFVSGQSNVLIGTQMIAKGLDLPMVTLVGVISADTALYLPDYRAGEHTFQLLAQVAGRAGRGILGGKVILQTYAPEHYAIQFAASHDYAGFYQAEIQRRREIGYPPFSRLARIICLSDSFERVESQARSIFKTLQERIQVDKRADISLIGPAPCFYAQYKGLHRWHIIVRGENPAAILEELRSTRGLQIDIDPVSLL